VRPLHWKAIVFDLDDTLYPEAAYVSSGYRAVGRWVEEVLRIPAPRATEELNELFVAGVRSGTFDHWLAARGLDPAHVRTMVAVYRGHSPEIDPFPAVPGLLDRLRQERVPLGIVTDGRARAQRAKVTALGLAPFFGTISYSEELGKEAAKPSPQAFLTALEQLGAAGSDAVYVADNPVKDFLGARRAGMASIRLRLDGGIYAGSEPPTPDHAPDVEVRTFAELEEALGA
jgi:putative hydrolase of the HAD superfamily